MVKTLRGEEQREYSATRGKASERASRAGQR
jgi:hypothetical protein